MKAFDAMFGGSKPVFRQPEQPLDEPYIEDEPMSNDDKNEAAHIAIIDKDSDYRQVFLDISHDESADLLSRFYELCRGTDIAKSVCNDLVGMVKEGIE